MDSTLGDRKHLRKHQNASFLSLTPFLCRIQAWFIDLKVILDLLASQNQKVQKGCFREKFRLVAKSLHLCFLLDSKFVLQISLNSGVKKINFFSKICFHCAPNATTHIQQATNSYIDQNYDLPSSIRYVILREVSIRKVTRKTS